MIGGTDLTSSPRSLGYRNGSPPAKLILRIPASTRSLIPRLASSMGRMKEVFAVWKQNPHS